MIVAALGAAPGAARTGPAPTAAATSRSRRRSDPADGRLQTMTAGQQLRFWLVGLVVALVAIYLLRTILLPFVAGMAIAYFLDPACDRLEMWKLSRTAATAVVTLIFAVLVVIALVMIVPLLADQFA